MQMVGKLPGWKIAFLFSLYLFLLPDGMCQQAQDYLSADSLRSIVAVLAADSLRGRGNFTPELEKAATYINHQFEAARLSHFGDFSSFYIPFIYTDNNLQSIEEVVVDNVVLNPRDYYFNMPFNIPPTVSFDQFTKKYPGVVSDAGLLSLLNQYINSSSEPLLVILPAGQKKQLKYIQKQAAKLHPASHCLLLMAGDIAINNLVVQLNPAVRKRMLFNLIGVLPGKSLSQEMVIISAHYDHVGVDNAISGDKIFNGANDNASGTAAMLSLMKYYADRGDNERTIVFIAFAGEELGIIGSNFSTRYFDAAKVAAMFNFEMLGKASKGDEKKLIMTDFDQWKFGSVMKKYCSDIDIIKDPYPAEKLNMRSDHYPFVLKNIPASTFMLFDPKDTTYHKPGDEISTLNFENMAVLVKGLLPGIDALVSGKETLTKKAK